MSREIRFRAWDPSKGRFVIESDLVHVALTGNVSHCSDSGISNRNDLVLQQYTGLKDKNSVEIYEGDILSLKKCPEFHTGCTCEKTPHPDFTGQVVYERRSFECYEVGSDWSLYEVIGNIYESPELLEPSKQPKAA